MPALTRIVIALAFAVSALGLAACSGGTDLEGTSWRLTEWSVSAQSASEFETTLEFKKAELGGKAPVNSYGGSYEAKSSGSIEIGDVNRTLMAGPEPANRAEETYFKLLEQVERYEVSGETLTLSDANGNERLIYEKVE